MKEIQRNRLLNVLLYILKDFRYGVDYIKLYKILYFAHRKHLAETGLPLVADTFKAWKKGPVPSFTGSVIKRTENKENLPADMEIFKNKIRVNKYKKVFGKSEPDYASLTPTAMRILDSTVQTWKSIDSNKISDISHKDFSWQEAYENHYRENKSPVMKQYRIAQDGKASDEMLSLVREYYSINPIYYNHKTNPALTDKLDEIVSVLTECLLMKPDWDGMDADTINPLSTWNCHKWVVRRDAHVELVRYVYPTPTGNICMDWEKNGAKISCEFGPHSMAFYYQDADRKNIYDSPALICDEAGLCHLGEYLRKLSE